MKKIFISFIIVSSILFSIHSKAMDPHWLNQLWSALPGFACYYYDSAKADIKYQQLAAKDKFYLNALNMNYEKGRVIEKLILATKSTKPDQENLNQYLRQLPEKEQAIVRRLGLKPAALNSRLNYYQNQEEIIASRRRLNWKEKEDAGLKVVLNYFGLMLGIIIRGNS